MTFLYMLNQNYPIYYLHPSFGYYFEVFYLEPHGLVYELHAYPAPKVTFMAPVPDEQEIKMNQDIWGRIEKKSLGTLPSLAKLDPDADKISVSYSVAMDVWGVDLQKAGHLQEANAQFAEAARVNPDNFIAKINKEYNEHLQKNDHRPIDSGDLIYKALNLYRGPVPILKYNGPPDEPDVDLEFGKLMAGGHDLRQAAGLFERRLQLLPQDVDAELDLAKTYVDMGQPDKAIAMVQKLRANPNAKKWDVSRVEALAYYAKNDFATAEKLMQIAVKEDPNDEGRIAILADFYRVTAYAALKEMNSSKDPSVRAKLLGEATRRFNNALTYLNQELQLLETASQSSTNPYGIPEILLRKAEVEMMLKSFAPAIATLSRLLELQPANPTAVLNRAIAEIQLNQIPAAKEDYKALRKLLPQQAYAIEYGLAEIAAREKNRPEEIRRLKRYLDSAPDDLPEYQQVKTRLRKLESQ